ncbi:MAG: DUF4012 domain-containing protein [Patescibacteria group bacterium]
MKKDAPNFLTCPIIPAAPEPEKTPPRDFLHQEKIEVQAAQAKTTPNVPRPPVQDETTPTQRPRRHARRFIWAGLAVLLIVLLGATVPAGVEFSRAAWSAQSAKQHLTQAKTMAEKMDLEGAQSEVALAKDDLISARTSLGRVGFWRDLPGIGTQLRALEDAALAGTQTLEGAGEILSVFQTVTEALRGGSLAAQNLNTGIAPTRRFSDLSRDEKRELLRKFDAALPELRMASIDIDLALQSWNRVPQDELFAPVRSALKPLADVLPQFKQTLDQAVPLIEAALPLMGYPQKITYLMALQNSDELRPGGGFIGNVGSMSVDSGEITDFGFTDVYNIDNPASFAWKEKPPQPLAERLGINAWFLRDANWSPDFPTSAERMLDFYTREVTLATGKPPADQPSAVLALEPAVFKALLRLTGPLTVDGITFTQDNFFDKIQYEVEQGFLKQGIALAERKAIVGKIGDAMLERLKALPAARWPEVLDVLTKAFERKQIMLYARNNTLLSVLDRRGWTGRVTPTQDDFMWVVDANLAALKTDGVMEKTVEYKLDLTAAQGPLATVTLKYRNTATRADWRYTRYRSYTRVYVPEGSQLISSSGAMRDDLNKTGGAFIPGKVDVMKELGKTVYGAFWSVELGQTGTLSFTYRLPQSVADQAQEGKYRLDWLKQAGADDTRLTLDLKFGKNIQSAVPAEAKDKWGDSRYELNTDSIQDRMFEMKLVQ